MMNGAMHGAGWIFMILFWTLIVLGIVALGKWLFSTGSAAEQHGREPLETLKQRCARGEVSRDQYEEIRPGLSNPEGPYPFPRCDRLKG